MIATHDGHHLTASGPDLREYIQEDTGYDPVAEPAFAWSNELPCDDCGIHDSTAKVNLNGEALTRLCAECYVKATR